MNMNNINMLKNEHDEYEYKNQHDEHEHEHDAQEHYKA